MRRSIGFLLAVLATAALSGACDEDTPTDTPTTPTNPAIITETFAGAVNPNGAVTHSFTTEAAGTVTASLVAIGPDSATRIGLSIGTWNGLSCAINCGVANDNAAQGVTVTGSASALGSFCVRIYDIGQLAGNISYEIRVTHP